MSASNKGNAPPAGEDIACLAPDRRWSGSSSESVRPSSTSNTVAPATVLAERFDMRESEPGSAMLIASLSDIHTDFEENRDVVVKLAAHIHREKADVVIVAGDVSHKNDRINRALRALRETAKTVAYVPGNHDLWFDVPFAPERADLDTWHRYHVELKELTEAAGAHYLPAGPLVIGDLAIVGSCGGYDYSLAPE